MHLNWDFLNYNWETNEEKIKITQVQARFLKLSIGFKFGMTYT